MTLPLPNLDGKSWKTSVLGFIGNSLMVSGMAVLASGNDKWIAISLVVLGGMFNTASSFWSKDKDVTGVKGPGSIATTIKK